MLRLAQFRLAAASGEGSDISETAAALLREMDTEQDATIRRGFEALALSTVLTSLGIAEHLGGWVAWLRRFRALVESDADLQGFKNTVEAGSSGTRMKFYGSLFSIGATGISTVARLEQVVDELRQLDAEERRMWLQSYIGGPTDFGIFVNGPWSAEHKRNAVNSEDAAERYRRMAELTKDWGMRELTMQLNIARAVMLDEYGNDREQAFATLDEAEAELGGDVLLDRARAKIYWRADDSASALKIWRRIAGGVGQDSFVERAYAMREAAINAAKADDWSLAETWFLEAEKGARSSKLDNMVPMAIGLLADAGVAALKVGVVDRALTLLVSAVDALANLDPDACLRAAYCHRVVRHTVLWAQSQIEKRETLIDGEPIVITAGTCSNPEPPAAIRDLPLGPLDLVWYMLAEAEIAAGVDIGLLNQLRSKLVIGPIPVMEVGIRTRLVSKAIEGSDAPRFAEHLMGHLEAMAFLRD
ncbi:MAG: hypothetical protein QOD94_636, partial [Alphaproteobacteria bacterium]|nr:hypothetical protein [Alphaproteobacteria bacterium]